MATAFENGVVIVLFGGAVLGGFMNLKTAFFDEDEIISPRLVTVPATAQTVTVEAEASTPVVSFVLPARTAQQLEIALVAPKWGSAGDVKNLGYRLADLQECRAYLPTLSSEAGKDPIEYLCCFGNRGEGGWGSYGGMLKLGWKSKVYETASLDLHDHMGGVEAICGGKYVGVKM
jgi:hypothetical protein